MKDAPYFQNEHWCNTEVIICLTMVPFDYHFYLNQLNDSAMLMITANHRLLLSEAMEDSDYSNLTCTEGLAVNA